jgi:signal transduction histidine kinase
MQNSVDLNEVNALLEERQQHIEEQTEEIRINNEWLKMVNDKVQEQAHLMEETNKELVLSNATKDKLFSIIAHDLKGPFSSIMNFSEILYKKSGNLSEEKHHKFVYAIYESSHRVYDLLENLLQWSRMQTQSMGYSPEEFDIKEQIDSIYLLQRSHIDEKKIAFYINVEENQMVYADRNMLNTIMRNLIGNAIKFTEHGSIHVTVSQQGNNALFTIEDTGIGIPDTKLAGIFEIDSKKSTAGTKGENGSGLGLIICRDFIQLHGGSISIKSQQGRGTIISFTLPCQII